MKALITGIAGQDGSYLAELLLSKGYEVHGIVRRHSVSETQSHRINHIFDNIHLHYGDMTDFASLLHIIQKVKPDEIYNLAAQSHVKVSEETPLYTLKADGEGVVNLLEILRLYHCKMYQASTSEMFGNATTATLNERTPLNPVSPYGWAKLYAHGICGHYREAYGLPIYRGILFNHTSVRRGETFVEQKIVKGLVEVSKGLRTNIELGNLDAVRDIGYAPEYVEAMWLMMQKEPDDYVIGTEMAYSVREIVQMVCEMLGLYMTKSVECSDKYLRAQELNHLKADCTKAFMELGWKAKKQLPEILEEMVKHWQQKT